MPGPRNSRAKRRVSIQKEKTRVARKVSGSSTSSAESEPLPTPNERDDAPIFAPQPRIASPSHSQGPVSTMEEHAVKQLEHRLAKLPLEDIPPIPQPCIHDPGNGPRVKDLIGFLMSPFSSEPSWDVEDCMAYHQQEVMDFLTTLLPFEQGVILWYNRTRENARICPTCRRFYHLGDRLPMYEFEPPLGERKEALLSREQDQSGLCSFMCFGAASFNYPGAIRAWGVYDHEMDEGTRTLLNGPGEGIEDEGLGMYLKLSRQDDPGFRTIIDLCYEEQPTDYGSDISDEPDYSD